LFTNTFITVNILQTKKKADFFLIFIFKFFGKKLFFIFIFIFRRLRP
tara:strand:+ start:36662 stop:36802 length:141 start_codon:yes stop_codon:yes gene_type:complete